MSGKLSRAWEGFGFGREYPDLPLPEGSVDAELVSKVCGLGVVQPLALKVFAVEKEDPLAPVPMFNVESSPVRPGTRFMSVDRDPELEELARLGEGSPPKMTRGLSGQIAGFGVQRANRKAVARQQGCAVAVGVQPRVGNKLAPIGRPWHQHRRGRHQRNACSAAARVRSIEPMSGI